MQPCPNLNELTGTTGKDWMLWSIDTVAKYNDCKARHGKILLIGLCIAIIAYTIKLKVILKVLNDLYLVALFS